MVCEIYLNKAVTKKKKKYGFLPQMHPTAARVFTNTSSTHLSDESGRAGTGCLGARSWAASGGGPRPHPASAALRLLF